MAPQNLDVESIAYNRSESEFSRAQLRGFLEMMMGLITGHNMHLLSFDEVVEKLRLKQAIYRGLQDIPVKNISGSTGRYEDFTRHFLPRSGARRDKERWRNIYTLAVSGKGFPPIDVYKIDQVYFVKDGNHRVSVARELGWETIPAHVTELPSPISLDPEVEPNELLIKEECAYFLEKTELDKTRPGSKERIHITAPGGYRRLINHIELHRYLLDKEQRQGPHPDEAAAFKRAAANWYDEAYLPITEEIRRVNVLEHFPGRTETDLYIWLVKNQVALRRRHKLEGLDMPSSASFWLAYLKDPAKQGGFEEIELSEAAREFLESIEEEEQQPT